MPTFLFSDIIVGPIKSRRLGLSLGVNLLPTNRKICSFDCTYCECGYNPDNEAPKVIFPELDVVSKRLETKLKDMSSEGLLPDVITFAGNGEPTLHPQFSEVIDETLRLRNIYCPNTKIAVLSNASGIHNPKIFNALMKVDDNILKLDSAIPETVKLLNNPAASYDLSRTVEYMKKFNGHVFIQTLFAKGFCNGKIIDNTTDEEVSAWLKLVKYISPRGVTIYPIDRDTPLESLEKIPSDKLDEIAEKVKALGISVQVTH